MEKDGRSGRAACANFSQLYYFVVVFFMCFVKVFGLFLQLLAFLLILQDFEHILHIFCVLIFKTQSFACAIL